MKKTAQSRSAKVAKVGGNQSFPPELTSVTAFTKALALIIIFGSVFLSFILGRLYQMTLPA
jgi:hypothetical protein